MPQAGINDERENFQGDASNGQGVLGTGDATQEGAIGEGNGIQDENAGNTDAEISQAISTDAGSTKIQKDTEVEAEVDEYIKSSLGENILGFNSFKLNRLYPKSMTALKEFMTQKSNLPTDDDTLLGVLIYTPRSVLYEFFDSKKLFINIFGSDEYWRYTWAANESSIPFKSRVFAEAAGFEEGFQLLEGQLK